MGLKIKKPDSIQQSPIWEANSDVGGLNIPDLTRHMLC
jgi:hypothetical protein